MVQRLLNYYPNYSTRRLYFGEVETPYFIHVDIPTKPVRTSFVKESEPLARTNYKRSSTQLLHLIGSCEWLLQTVAQKIPVVYCGFH